VNGQRKEKQRQPIAKLRATTAADVWRQATRELTNHTHTQPMHLLLSTNNTSCKLRVESESDLQSACEELGVQQAPGMNLSGSINCFNSSSSSSSSGTSSGLTRSLSGRGSNNSSSSGSLTLSTLRSSPPPPITFTLEIPTDEEWSSALSLDAWRAQQALESAAASVSSMSMPLTFTAMSSSSMSSSSSSSSSSLAPSPSNSQNESDPKVAHQAQIKDEHFGEGEGEHEHGGLSGSFTSVEHEDVNGSDDGMKVVRQKSDAENDESTSSDESEPDEEEDEHDAHHLDLDPSLMVDDHLVSPGMLQLVEDDVNIEGENSSEVREDAAAAPDVAAQIEQLQQSAGRRQLHFNDVFESIHRNIEALAPQALPWMILLIVTLAVIVGSPGVFGPTRSPTRSDDGWGEMMVPPFGSRGMYEIPHCSTMPSISSHDEQWRIASSTSPAINAARLAELKCRDQTAALLDEIEKWKKRAEEGEHARLTQMIERKAWENTWVWQLHQGVDRALREGKELGNSLLSQAQNRTADWASSAWHTCDEAATSMVGSIGTAMGRAEDAIVDTLWDVAVKMVGWHAKERGYELLEEPTIHVAPLNIMAKQMQYRQRRQPAFPASANTRLDRLPRQPLA